MSFISSFKNHLLKSRVISLSYHVDKVMVYLAKCDLENPDEHFLYNDPMKYYEVKFYSHLASKWRINPQYFSKGELEKYNEAVQKMKDFTQYYGFVKNLHDFFWELKTLYIDISRETGTPNVWNRRDYATNTFISDTKSGLQKYVKLIDQLQDHPEWKEKVQQEIGYQIHMIYTNLCSNEEFMKMFREFDKQYFFK